VGHSTIAQAVAFAAATEVATLVPFHHDPDHADSDLDRLFAELREHGDLPFELVPGVEGATFEL
jgi:ribonuclease BN (tRNA processing enzyme)